MCHGAVEHLRDVACSRLGEQDQGVDGLHGLQVQVQWIQQRAVQAVGCVRLRLCCWLCTVLHEQEGVV